MSLEYVVGELGTSLLGLLAGAGVIAMAAEILSYVARVL